MNSENRLMRVLSALGIIFILSGHLQLGIFEIGGLFPYYSFHVYIFLFVSGYFYRKENEKNITKYIISKAKKLLIPYFVFNFIYGIIVTMLNAKGFSLGGSMSLYNLFVAPFDGGHQFMLNAPAWFLIALFEIEVINVVLRKAFSFIKIENDLIIGVIVLALGIATVYLAIGGHVWGYYKDAGRVLIMLPGYYLGIIYKNYIEGFIPKTKSAQAVFAIAMSLVAFVGQALVRKYSAGLAFSTVWVSGFANGPVIPFVTVLFGIMFWLGIAYLIVFLFEKNAFLKEILEIIVIIGRNTMSIMLHHLFVFFIINSVIYAINVKKNLYHGFDALRYHTDVYYAFDISKVCLMGYLILGILAPILLNELYKFLGDMIKRKKEKTNA